MSGAVRTRHPAGGTVMAGASRSSRVLVLLVLLVPCPVAGLLSILLVPPPPREERSPVCLGDDLARVPELKLEAPPREELTTEQWRRRKAHATAAALHLNEAEEDGFIKALLRTRPDLAGLPVTMGK